MKTAIKILLCSLAIYSTALYSESEIRIRNLEERVKTLEGNQKKSFEPITPNAGPKVKDGQDLFFIAEFLYWTARLDSFTYAKSGIGDSLSQNHVHAGNSHSVDWSWDPGFRVGLGWETDHGGWDIQLKYTWYYNRVTTKTTNTPLYPGFTIKLNHTVPLIDTLLPIGSAAADWNLHYQIADFELGRNYFINRYLKLRPFIGLKGTWQNQNLTTTFTHVPFFGVTDIYNVKAKIHQEIWGGGLLFGLNTSWQFASWCSCYGDFAASAMWLSYDLDRKDSFTIDLPAFDQFGFTTANIRDNLSNIKPLLEWAIGIRFETYFYTNRFHILLQFGWEAAVWPNQTLYLNLPDHYDRFDLNLHGLTIRSRFDF